MNHPHEPSDGYLWDRSGAPDAEVQRLERLLAPYAFREERRAARVSAAGAHEDVRRRSMRRPRRRAWLAAAAMLAVFAIGLGGWLRYRLHWPAGEPWQTVAIAGDARIDGRVMDGATALPTGGLIQTGAGGRVRLKAARIGQVLIGEDSRLRLVETRSGRHRLQLERGTLWARVWAPPGAFAVQTRSADAYDLGCEFVLRVDDDGNGRLSVRSGWVMLERYGRESLVPEGASADVSGRGPGTPYDAAASPAFVAALREIDARGPAAEADGPEVRRLVAAARPRDAISVVSLLTRYPHLAEGPLFDRAAQLLPSAPRVTREDLRRRGANALNHWWQALPYPRLKRWWQHWPDAFAPTADADALLRQEAGAR